MNRFPYLILSLIVLLPLFLSQTTIASGGLTSPEVNHVGKTISIGAIFDYTSRPGKEAKVAMEMAIHDFEAKTNQSFVLHFRNSQSKPTRAFLAAKELIDKHDVKAILGAHTWEEASAIAEVASEAHDPPVFLSLADTSQPWATHRWPFLVPASPDQTTTQMNAVAAIAKSWGWNQVTFIYENAVHSLSSASVISHLSQAIRQTGGELTHILPITSFSPFDEEFELLKKQKRTVFVVHTSLELGIRLFQKAKKMEITGEGYAWIVTNRITDLLHSINIPTSLNGLVGVKTYFPENTPEFQDFKKRFRLKFRTDYTEEDKDEPGVFAVQAYEAATEILTGERKLAPATTVEIVSVIGKSYQSGYWTKELGFSETVNDDEAIYNPSMEKLGKILWPVQPWYSKKRRRILAENGERLRVGVPGHSLFKQFVNVEYDPETNTPTSYSGFSIAVFEEMMKRLPSLTYDFFAFDGSYNELVEQIPSGNYDAVAGDVTILVSRRELADFTQPYTESGLEMIVPVRSKFSNRIWLFKEPFTKEMWGLIAAITIYNGFAVWLIERNDCSHLRGSVSNQIGTLIWLSFTTLFTLRGDKLNSNLSRMTMVVWLFVALIITQSYTASLASMLTAQRLEPTIKDIETLRRMNATVGYCNGSFINYYLTEVLDFKLVKIKSYRSTDQYAHALQTGEIAAIFLEVPTAKLFLSQYCRSFVRTGETFKVGGFGFAFRKDYPMFSDLNKALMNVSESGKLLELEKKYIASEKCKDEEFRPDEDASLSPDSFWVLFGLSGGTSTVALVIYAIVAIRNLQMSAPQYKNVFTMIAAIAKRWQHQRRQSSSRVASAESPPSYPANTSNPLNQV